jgi:two-component system, OmpR family, sensor histidine kinase SenX3
MLVTVVLGLAVVVLAGGWWRAARAHASDLVALGERLDDRSQGLASVTSSDHAGVMAAVDRAAARVLAQRDDEEADRRRLEGAIEALPIGIVVADEDGEVVLRNPIARRYEDARHGDALVEAATRELVGEALSGAGRDADIRKEVALVGPPRQVLDVRAKALVNERDPAPNGAVVVIRDVSEMRRLADVRRDFVANVSHELRTPIGALVVLADTLVEETDPATIRHLAEHLASEAERLGRIVHDLLDLSILETLDELPREPVELDRIVDEAIERIRAAADVARIGIRLIDPPPAHTVMVDRLRLVSAVYNLLDNALKYSDPGSCVEVGVTVDDPMVSIRVIDHGCGIPARDCERIFERFYRVDRARARATGGTGLGLAFVRHVAEGHGGFVTVTSEEGLGSVFTIVIPAVHP